ncbi:MAG: hypothetical protein ACXAC2_24625, partial [Candidatus Kariarchaeaceae archaeon]
GEAYSIVYNSLLITIENSAPIIQGSLVITPNNPAPGNTLFLSYIWLDGDSSDVERDTEIRWYKNNVVQPAFNDLLVVHGSNIIKDDRWNVTVRPSDGSEFGVVKELSLVIGNTKPEVIINNIGGTNVYTTTNLFVNSSFSQSLLLYDGDGDTIVWFEYKWFINDVENATYYNQTIIPASETSKDEQWSFTLQISDGETISDLFNSLPVIIQNTPPIVSYVAISPGYTLLYTNNSLDLVWSYYDEDLDPEIASQMKVRWYLDLVEQTAFVDQISIPSNFVSKGDRWTVQVQVYDGTSYSIVNQSIIVQISNTAPTASNVLITENNPYTIDDLGTYWVFSDDDGDTPSVIVNITWYKNGIHQSTYDNISTLPSGATTKGENWFYRLQVFDGEEWSIIINSQTITILNSNPIVDSLGFINSEYQQFIVEDEDIEIEYIISDPDTLDSDQSKIMWFIDGIYQSQYDNLTLISSSELTVGQIWSFQIIPSDGFDSGNISSSLNMIIENRPQIVNVLAQPVNDTEGHYILWFEVDVNPVNPLQDSQPNMNIDITVDNNSITSVPATPVNNTFFMYEWQYMGSTFVGLDVILSLELSSRVRYSTTTSIVSGYTNFNFSLEDHAPPRVKEVVIIFDDDENPNNLTFIVRIEEFGTGIDNATLYYSFRMIQSNLPSQDYQEAILLELNATHYWVTVNFDADSSVMVLYQIQVLDKSGNFDPNAYPLGLDESLARRYTPLTGGIPLEEVMTYVGIIIVIMLIFSFVIIKKFRSKELVGLDVELVMAQTREIKEDDFLDKELDTHTLGIVVSIFDQTHGPIPLVADPIVLGDNFSQLVELSDLSFSTGRFVEDFEREVHSTFEFSISPQLRVNSITYAFSLNRPDARGGAENITLNILVHEAFYPLVGQFVNQLKEIAHQIHDLMHEKQESNELLLWEVRRLRRKISAIILAYKEIYGTTELIEEEEED